MQACRDDGAADEASDRAILRRAKRSGRQEGDECLVLHVAVVGHLLDVMHVVPHVVHHPVLLVDVHQEAEGRDDEACADAGARHFAQMQLQRQEGRVALGRHPQQRARHAHEREEGVVVGDDVEGVADVGVTDVFLALGDWSRVEEGVLLDHIFEAFVWITFNPPKIFNRSQSG